MRARSDTPGQPGSSDADGRAAQRAHEALRLTKCQPAEVRGLVWRLPLGGDDEQFLAARLDADKGASVKRVGAARETAVDPVPDQNLADADGAVQAAGHGGLRPRRHADPGQATDAGL